MPHQNFGFLSPYGPGLPIPSRRRGVPERGTPVVAGFGIEGFTSGMPSDLSDASELENDVWSVLSPG
jgi:hypothetical protein